MMVFVVSNHEYCKALTNIVSKQVAIATTNYLNHTINMLKECPKGTTQLWHKHCAKNKKKNYILIKLLYFNFSNITNR